MTIKTRFAPSPTGYLHIGGARTALFSWLYARQHGGHFVLRIEDTDRERSTPESVQAILDGMAWLGLDYDEGPYFQTERLVRYQTVIQQLLDEDKAYYCYCSPEELSAMRETQMARKEKPRYNGKWRDYKGPAPKGVKPVVRFKSPTSGQLVIEDRVYQRITVENAELDDLIIARSDGTPTYNFSVVVDDLDMGITHVIRGEDHINNTPRQIHILKALGAAIPHYAHLPMILGEDGKRMSKRHGALSVMQYRADGYLPDALLNYLARLGWSHGDQELFSRSELLQLFALDAVNKSGSRFDLEKLAWVNRHYMQKTADPACLEVLRRRLLSHGLDPEAGPALPRLIAVMAGRVNTLSEMAEQSRYFFADFDQYDPKASKKQLRSPAVPILQALYASFEPLDNWSGELLKQAIAQVVIDLDSKIAKVGPPLRVAVTGGLASPALDVTLELIGRRRVLQRIERAIAFIKAQP